MGDRKLPTTMPPTQHFVQHHQTPHLLVQARSLKPPSSSSTLHGNPHDTHNNIHPLVLASFVLVTPHPIPLVVPVRAARAVHASAPNFALHLFAVAGSCALLLLAGTLAARRRIRQVLDDSAVDRELVPSLAPVGFQRAGFGRGFCDERLEDRVDDGVVPRRGLVVLVGCRG